MVTIKNFYEFYEPPQLQTGGQQNNVSSSVKRKRRSTQSSLEPPLPSDELNRYDHVRMMFIFEASGGDENLLVSSKLKDVCEIENSILSASSLYAQYCLSIYDGKTTKCYSSYSLGNYIALLNNRTTCRDITDQDVLYVKNLLLQCHPYFVKQSLKGSCATSSCEGVPANCTKHNAVYNIFQFLTDNEMSPSNDMFLKYTTSFPQASGYDLYDELYLELKDGVPERDGVKLASFWFMNYKFDLFQIKLLTEVIFPALAMIIVFLIMWFFLGSFILTFTGLFCIIYAIGLSYFLYTMVFKIDFFPFLNVTTLVFLVGIGADDAFVYYDIWRQTLAANPCANIMQLTLKTLRYAALSMLVTSLTTASAFFAGVSSSITAIRLFGLFAGTSILTNYLLMITYFPAVVALHEKWVLKYKDGHSSLDDESCDLDEVQSPKTGEPIAQNMSERNIMKSVVNSPVKQNEGSICFLQVIDFPCSLLISATSFFKTAGSKVFEDWLPKAVIELRYVWIALLGCLTVGFLCVNFVKPGLQLPNTSDFQVFSSSHPLENYYLNYKSYFRFTSSQQSGGMWLELFWGIKLEDNGNHLNPDDYGTLQLDESFDKSNLFSPAGQKFLRYLCQSIEKQPFFVTFPSSDTCPIEAFIKTCTSPGTACCGVNASFPFPADTAEGCLRTALSMPSSAGVGLLFDQQGKVIGFHLQIITGQSFTTSFTVMDDFWKKVTDWFDNEMAKAPTGLENGWVGCWNLDFYALQMGLSEGTYSSLGISVAVSFGVMLFTTLNILISIYAIITIIGIISITIGCLVLAGWQLNILESIVVSVAVGLSIDFTMHYGVAYTLAPDKSQRDSRVRYSLKHIGSAITMAALTTFFTGRQFLVTMIILKVKS